MAVKSSTDKRKASRKRSWEANRVAKDGRIAAQTAAEENNRKLGTTGKQRANAARKLKSALANSAAGNVTDLGDFTQYVTEEN